MVNSIKKGFGFFIKQDNDWKVSVLRSNVSMFLYRLVLPYMAVYTMALGATGTQLGIVNSLGMGAAAILGLLGGGIIDRTGVKKIYLLSIAILGASYLIYGLAGSWPILIVAMMAY